MKLETIKTRLSKDRPMLSVTLLISADVVNDLKKVTPFKGFSGYQSLLRAYVGAKLRKDLERMEGSAVAQPMGCRNCINTFYESGVGFVGRDSSRPTSA